MMQCHYRFTGEVSNFEAMSKVARFETAIAAREIAGAVGMIADELRLLIYTNEESAPPDRIALVGRLLEVLPARFSLDPDNQDEDWQDHGDGIQRNGELTIEEVDWLYHGVENAIRVASRVRQERFSDGDSFFAALFSLDSYVAVREQFNYSRQSKDAFLAIMEAVPW